MGNGKVYGYVRVSTRKQSTDNQANELIEHYPDADIRCDVISGTTSALDRTAFNGLITHALGKGDTLIVWSIDRLGRNLADILQTVELLTNKGVKLIVHQQQGIDFTTPIGKMTLGMLGSIAEMEREQMLERQRLGIAKAQKAGKYKGKQIDKELHKRINAMNADGIPKLRIAKELGIARQTVYNAIGKE